MKYWFALFCLPTLLAAAGPAPLITGAVRDQLGEPVAGALVSAGSVRTTTDSDGTFALQAQTAQVTISCAYCEGVEAPVGADDTVAVVIRRYRVLAESAPSSADLQALPYAHAESAISLAPFVVLNESARTLPGPRVSYYGASRFGGVLVDDGIPSYDIAAGVTAFRTLPAYGVLGVTLRDESDAFRYGDMAGGGTFFTRTEPLDGAAATAAGGKTNALQFAQHSGSSSYAFSFSGDGTETRQRAGASAQASSGDDTFDAQILAARDDIATEYNGSALSSLSAVRLHFQRTRAAQTYADLLADRAGYDALTSSALPVEGEWSDVALQAGVSSGAYLSPFGDAGLRLSTGFYDASAAGAPRVAGTILQMHISAGVQSQSGPFTWRAGVGAFDVAYDGGKYGAVQPMFAQMLLPSLSISYDAAPHWNVSAETSGSFRLPALTEAYAYGTPELNLPFDRYASQSAVLTYSDLRRVRVSVTAMHRNVSNLDDGSVNAAGASIVWEISPQIALRAWTLHVDDRSVPYAPVFRFGAAPQPATPASLWLTYGNANALRVDAIWRRDLLDYRPLAHFDASVSAPLAGQIRWFAGEERRAGTTYVTAGLRYSQP